MTRLSFLIGSIVAVLCLMATVWFLGGQAAREKARSDQMRKTIESGDRFNEGADNSGGAGWRDRLFPDATD